MRQQLKEAGSFLILNLQLDKPMQLHMNDIEGLAGDLKTCRFDRAEVLPYQQKISAGTFVKRPAMD